MGSGPQLFALQARPNREIDADPMWISRGKTHSQPVRLTGREKVNPIEHLISCSAANSSPCSVVLIMRDPKSSASARKQSSGSAPDRAWPKGSVSIRSLTPRRNFPADKFRLVLRSIGPNNHAFIEAILRTTPREMEAGQPAYPSQKPDGAQPHFPSASKVILSPTFANN